MPSPWARALTCTGCAECDPAIAEADRKADEAFWAEEARLDAIEKAFNAAQEKAWQAADEAFWAEEDARWNRQREQEQRDDAAFWAEQARLATTPGEDVQYVDSSWRERPQF